MVAIAVNKKMTDLPSLKWYLDPFFSNVSKKQLIYFFPKKANLEKVAPAAGYRGTPFCINSINHVCQINMRILLFY